MTPFGLAKEWSVPESEARRFTEMYYAAFPGIRRWKAEIEADFKSDRESCTILGRTRPVARDLVSSDGRRRSHARRAAVNTPVQGSAADIVTLAMLRLRNSKKLGRLRYKQVLQVHDEIILEGPQKNADAAV